MNIKKIKFNENKFKEVILFLLSQSPNKTIEGKKKIAKLLYFSDFNFFEVYEESVTGATYRALPMGPVPDELEGAIKEMRGKTITITKKDIGLENDMLVFSLKDMNIDPDLSFKHLSDDEKQVLRKVYSDYGNVNGKVLENISHSEAPYNAVVLGEYIPYELAFYRGKNKKELIGV